MITLSAAAVLFASVVAIADVPAIAADSVAPSTLVAHAAAYDGKAVAVAGSVAKYQQSKTMMGTVAAFQVCDTKCITVIDETNTAHANGDKITVDGTFQTTFKGPQRSFQNVVLIK